LNSAGTHIAAIVTVGEDQHDLLVYELKTKEGEVLSVRGDNDISSVHWLNDRKLVFELLEKKMYRVGLLAADFGRISHPYPLFQYYGSELIAVPKNNRLQPLVWNRYDGLDSRLGVGYDLGVCSADSELNTGAVFDLAAADSRRANVVAARSFNNQHILHSYPQPKSGIVVGYLADRDGQLAFSVTSIDGRPTLQRLAGTEWVKCPVDLDRVDVVGCGDQTNQLVVVGPRQEGKPRALQLMDAATGQLGAVLLQDQEYDFDGWLYRHPVTNEILGGGFERNGPRVFWFGESYRKLQKLLDARFPGYVVRIIGSDDAQNVFLVATFSDRQPVVFHWVNLEKHAAGLFKQSAPWIDPARMQPQSVIKFKTRDGRLLDAYLTLPAGASKQNPPALVVLPHGGPWVRDSWGFDGEAQFLASRGYAVLKPNYRGSTGYGWMFPEDDRFDFLKMQEDVTDATKAMIASGLIDGSRVAIMGGSFGGYLAVSGVVNEPALYRCAISNAGVFDWTELIHEKNDYRHDSSAYDWLLRRLGDPKKQQEKFEAISPLRHVEQIRVPVFVAGGKDDPNVEITQSKRLISALEKNHVPHETFLVSEEGHGMHHLNPQVELYTRIEAFLDKYLKPATPVATAP
jgi:acetyl esterase/lipase